MDRGAASSPTRFISEDLSEEEDEESFCLEQPRGATPIHDRSFGFDNGSFLSSNSPLLKDVVGENHRITVPVRIPSLEDMSPIAKRRRPPPMSCSGDIVGEGFGAMGKTLSARSDVKGKAKKQTSTPITNSMRRDSKTPQVSSVLFETPGTSEFGAGEPSRFVDSREIVALSVVEDSLVDSLDECDGDIVVADEAQPIDCSYVWLFDENNPSKTL
uniref:Uncharacterized protein n=1 Tax=Plectus sambesii TaxID=2011161 RepID=A0A914UQX8_9BILA